MAGRWRSSFCREKPCVSVQTISIRLPLALAARWMDWLYTSPRQPTGPLLTRYASVVLRRLLRMGRLRYVNAQTALALIATRLRYGYQPLITIALGLHVHAVKAQVPPGFGSLPTCRID